MLNFVTITKHLIQEKCLLCMCSVFVVYFFLCLHQLHEDCDKFLSLLPLRVDFSKATFSSRDILFPRIFPLFTTTHILHPSLLLRLKKSDIHVSHISFLCHFVHAKLFPEYRCLSVCLVHRRTAATLPFRLPSEKGLRLLYVYPANLPWKVVV
jgi:hypothetical protein